MPFLIYLFPFFGLFLGVKYFFQKHYHYGLLFFGFCYGYTVYFYSGDVIRYRDDFAMLVEYSVDDYFQLLQHLANDRLKFVGISINAYNSKPDVFALTLGFLVSRFTENPRWFFAMVSLIYVFLQIKFFEEVVRFTGKVNSKGWKLFFAALVLMVPFYVGVTGVRFWPALFVFAWMLMKYINTGNKKYLFFTTFSILFHYTFIFPVVVAFAASFLRLNRYVFKILIIIGIGFALLSSTTSSLDFITKAITVFESDSVTNATSGYLDEEQLAKRVVKVEATNWYVQWRTHLLNVFFILFFIFDFFNLNKWNKVLVNPIFDKMYQFFFLITLFTFNLGSMGRFVYVFYLLILLRIIQIQTLDCNQKLKKWNYYFIPILALHVIVTFRAGFYTIDPLLLISPSIALFFVESERSLSEFLIGH